MTPATRRQIDRQRLLVDAQRRRGDLWLWQEQYHRLLSTPTRSEDEAIAKHQALELMEAARPGWRD
jgi:hypothetical protein